ncbi:hypothetical protein [uncultured Flavobacterium sp.]|uniref:hypothetical protein n=1 Tax=uncultured Flavobacterium sp. TaxID=165435 RepID=UPI0030ED543F|tara:strand:- start:46147 stop:46383 length:237 start_codon:yes stop_codon:yes gene_type:complete
MIDKGEYFQKAMNEASEKLEDLLNKESVKFTSNIVELPKENNKPEIIVNKFGERQGTFEGYIRLNKNEIDFLRSFRNK